MIETIQIADLDISNTNQINDIIRNIDVGNKIQIMELSKTNRQQKAPITLIGRMDEQNGNGIVISKYKQAQNDDLIVIE